MAYYSNDFTHTEGGECMQSIPMERRSGTVVAALMYCNSLTFRANTTSHVVHL